MYRDNDFSPAGTFTVRQAHRERVSFQPERTGSLRTDELAPKATAPHHEAALQNNGAEARRHNTSPLPCMGPHVASLLAWGMADATSTAKHQSEGPTTAPRVAIGGAGGGTPASGFQGCAAAPLAGCRAERLQTQASNTKQVSPRHSVMSPSQSRASQSHSIMSPSRKRESSRHNGASPRVKRHPRMRTNQQQRRGPPFQRRSCSARNHAAGVRGLPSPAWCVSQWCK